MAYLNYVVRTFPDGELQVEVIEPINHKESYEVTRRITNADDLFVTDQIMDILDRHEVEYTININYLMGMRMDRVMDFNKPFTLKIVSEVFNRHHPKEVSILVPHSNRAISLIKNSTVENDYYMSGIVMEYDQLILPDRGAIIRYNEIFDLSDSICCEKVRDISTGEITSLNILNPQNIKGNSLLMIDDLCDGGGTFCGLYEKFKKLNPKLEIDLYVTHMVNKKGLERVCNTFSHVYTTNSYCDWNVEEFDNLTIFKVN